MDNQVVENVVQSTRDYDKFKFLGANRNVARGHIESIKDAFVKYGNLTQVQPILTNARLEIIDGQHRFIACQELDAPIYYTVVGGLGVEEARSMNILHRGWNANDFAHSYAADGDTNYQDYLNLREDYGTGHAITLAYIYNGEPKGMYKNFREGNLVIDDLAATKARLDMLMEVWEVIPNRGKGLAFAMLSCFRVEGYDQKRMLRKLTLYGDTMVKRFEGTGDNQRQLEEVYNYHNSASNYLRLY